jgi:FdhD protein
VREKVRVVENGRGAVRSDFLATEEPLEIRVGSAGRNLRLAVTMRTPGADFELAAGFLFSEGLIGGRDALRSIRYCVDGEADPEQRYNIVTADLAIDPGDDLTFLQRHFTIGSSCGVCGKGSLEALKVRGCLPVAPGPTVTVDLLYGLPGSLRSAQGIFDATGGLHAAALFDTQGTLLALREDVGRHNALDKLIGWALVGDMLPLTDRIIMVSGRTSFEIVQKCLTAGVPIICAVSAPSSLAVSLAREFGVTLVGFLRGTRFNVYSGPERIREVTGGSGATVDGSPSILTSTSDPAGSAPTSAGMTAQALAPASE